MFTYKFTVVMCICPLVIRELGSFNCLHNFSDEHLSIGNQRTQKFVMCLHKFTIVMCICPLVNREFGSL